MDLRNATCDVNFDSKVQIIDWVSDRVVAVLGFQMALGVMANSARYDTDHATINVRRLDSEDALALQVPADKPYRFRVVGL